MHLELGLHWQPLELFVGGICFVSLIDMIQVCLFGHEEQETVWKCICYVMLSQVQDRQLKFKASRLSWHFSSLLWSFGKNSNLQRCSVKPLLGTQQHPVSMKFKMHTVTHINSYTLHKYTPKPCEVLFVVLAVNLAFNLHILFTQDRKSVV